MTIPDTRLAKAAADLLAASSSETLVNHCHRTYRFGLELGERAGLAPDRELFWIGAALHDLGLTPAYDGDAPFEEVGANAAGAFLLGEGADPARADLVAEAIRLHLLPATAKDPRPEVALVTMGAAADVFGLRLDRIAPATVARIVEEYPRLGFTAAVTALVADQAARKPHSAIADLVNAGAADLIAATPFAD